MPLVKNMNQRCSTPSNLAKWTPSRPPVMSQRPQTRRPSSSPASTLDPEDLAKRLTMVLAQEHLRDLERKRRCWEAELLAARREQQNQARQHAAAAAAAAAAATSQADNKDHLSISIDSLQQQLPSLDQDYSLEDLPDQSPVAFPVNISGYYPQYDGSSSVLDTTTLRRALSMDQIHMQSLRHDSALDLQTIDEADHGSIDDFMETWHPYWSPVDYKQVKRSSGLTRVDENCAPDYIYDDVYARSRRLPTTARRPSELGYPPEWSQADNTQQASSRRQSSFVRRISAHTSPHRSQSIEAQNRLGRCQSLMGKVESYWSIHPKHSISTTISSGSDKDGVHGDGSTHSPQSPTRTPPSGPRLRMSLLKPIQAYLTVKRPPAKEEIVEKQIDTDCEGPSVLRSRTHKRSSFFARFHL